MPPASLGDLELWSSLETGLFWNLPEEDYIRQIYDAFRSETDRLKNAIAMERRSPHLSNGHTLPRTPSEVIFGENFDEVNRTYTGVLALRWVWNNDYPRFTNGQPQGPKLKPDSFQWLYEYFHNNIQTPMDILSVILSMVVNDVGKDDQLVDDYFEKTGDDSLRGKNHDIILLEAAKEDMIPCLNYLDESHRNDVMLGLELGQELNAGQLAQAENVPQNLEGLLDMQGEERAFNFKWIEQILDVAGAAGHVFSNGCKNLIEPVFQSFKTVHEVSLSIIREERTLREGYDHILLQRAALLAGKGFRQLSVDDPEERALLRLLTMGRTHDLEQAELFDASFAALDPGDKKQLVDGLNIDAIQDNETAVIPYYMPAMIAAALANTKNAANAQEAMSYVWKLLARSLHPREADVQLAAPRWETGKTNTWPKTTTNLPRINTSSNFEGRVIERNMSQAKDIISSPLFRENPSILDTFNAPPGHILQRRRTSTSV